MKVDPKREIAAYTAPRGRCEVITVPTLQYLMVDGHGDPNTATAYQQALSTLYPVAYGLKLRSRTELDRDYVVPPLEALWSAADLTVFTTARDKSRWDWTLMIMVPDWLGAESFEAVRADLRRTRRAPALDAIRLESLDEGRAVQTLHVGRYDDEGPVLEQMHRDQITGAGLQPVGRHHEIYLSDARRTRPDRLRTILRQPVTEADG